jgi:hypothetical protein
MLISNIIKETVFNSKRMFLTIIGANIRHDLTEVPNSILMEQ